MEKTSIKRLGYGFSALVMSISAVNFMPAFSNSAYALEAASVTDVAGVAANQEVELTEDLEISTQIANNANIVIDLKGHNIIIKNSVDKTAFKSDVTIKDTLGKGYVSGAAATLGNATAGQGVTWKDAKPGKIASGYNAYALANGDYYVDVDNVETDVVTTAPLAVKLGGTVKIADVDKLASECSNPSISSDQGAAGISFNAETGEVTFGADSAAGVTHEITFNDGAKNFTSKASVAVYSYDKVNDINITLGDTISNLYYAAFENVTNNIPVTTFKVDGKKISDANYKPAKAGVYTVEYTVTDTDKGSFTITVSPKATTTTIVENLAGETEVTREVKTVAGLEVNTGEEDFSDVFTISNDTENGVATFTFTKPVFDTTTYFYMVGNTKQALKLNVYDLPAELSVEAGGTIDLSQFADGLAEGALQTVGISANNSGTTDTYYDLTDAKKSVYTAGVTGNTTDAIKWTFKDNKTFETKIYTTEKAAAITDAYVNINSAATVKASSSYAQTNQKGEVTYTVAGLYGDSKTYDAKNEFKFEKAGHYVVTYTEKFGDEVINTAEANIYVTGVNAETVSMTTGEEYSIDLTTETNAYGIKTDTINDNGGSSSKLGVSGGDGVYTVKPTAKGKYTFQVTVDEQTGATTYAKKNYTYTFNVYAGMSAELIDGEIDLSEGSTNTTAGIKASVTDGKLSVKAEEGSNLEVSKTAVDGVYTISAGEGVKNGAYKVAVSHLDDNGETLESEDFEITVTGVAEEEPVIEEYALSVLADKEGEVEIEEVVTFTWESNGTVLVSVDSNEAVEANTPFEVAFATAGAHTVTISVKEDSSKTQTFTFTVAEPTPVVEAKLDVAASAETVKVGETVTFTIDATLAEETDKVLVKIDDGEAEETDGKTYVYEAEKEGTYAFTFSLDGAEEVTKTVTVEAAETPIDNTDPMPADLEVKHDTVLVSLDEVDKKEFTIASEHDIHEIDCLYDEASCSDFGIQFGDTTYKFTKLESAGEYTLNFYHKFSDQEERTLIATTNVVVYDIAEDNAENANETLTAIVSGLEDLTAEVAAEGSDIEGIVEKLRALENLNELMAKVSGTNPDDKLTALAKIVDKIASGETLTTEVVGADEPAETSSIKSNDRLAVSDLLTDKGIELSGVSYYNIDVVVKDGDEEIAKLSELDGEGVTIAIAVGEDPAGTSRTYYVVRVHNGVAEIVAEGVSARDGKITFTSNKFSTYAVAYTETEISTPTPETPTEESTTDGAKSTVKTPDTGAAKSGISNATASAIITGLATASLITLVGAVKFAKRNK